MTTDLNSKVIPFGQDVDTFHDFLHAPAGDVETESGVMPNLRKINEELRNSGAVSIVQDGVQIVLTQANRFDSVADALNDAIAPVIEVGDYFNYPGSNGGWQSAKRIATSPFYTNIGQETASALTVATLSSNVEGVSKHATVDHFTDAGVVSGNYSQTGAFVASANWRSTPLIPYNPKATYRYTGFGHATLVASVSAWAANGSFLGSVYINGAQATDVLITAAMVPSNTAYLRASAAATGSYVRAFNETAYSIERGALGALPAAVDKNAADVATMLKTAAQVDAAQSATAQPGYINLSGTYVANANWKTTPRVEYSDAATYLLTAFGNTSLVSTVSMWGANDVFLGTLYVTASQVTDVRISSALPGWNAACTGLRASGAISGSNVFAFKVTRKDIDESLLPSMPVIKADISALKAGAPTSVRMLAPTEVYGVVGETKYLYGRQIVQDPSLDLAWNVQFSSDLVAPITPATTADIPLVLQGMGRDGAAVQLAAFNMKVCRVDPVNPAAPRFILPLGDSKTDGVSNSNISGAYVNELSRRLTGIGRAVNAAGETLPTARALSNFRFIGTRGTEVVKHEGRPGWNATDYLTKASGPGALSNAFWNPSTSQFDLAYYMVQNGFTDVASDGSNLTLLIWLGWNDLYSMTGAASAVILGNLIDRVHATHPLADIVLLGLNPPPRLNHKGFTGTRYVSPAQIFQRAVVEYGQAYRSLAAGKTRCQFLQLSQEYDPERAYVFTAQKTSRRGVATVAMADDYVHEAAGGYAMVADIVNDKLLYDYCRA